MRVAAALRSHAELIPAEAGDLWLQLACRVLPAMATQRGPDRFARGAVPVVAVVLSRDSSVLPRIARLGRTAWLQCQGFDLDFFFGMPMALLIALMSFSVSTSDLS
jgi:hypothetical protein